MVAINVIHDKQIAHCALIDNTECLSVKLKTLVETRKILLKNLNVERSPCNGMFDTSIDIVYVATEVKNTLNIISWYYIDQIWYFSG